MTNLSRGPASLGLLAALAALTLQACQPKEITSAKLYMRNNEWARAIEQLELAVKNHPNNAEAHFLLGEAYGIRGRYAAMNREFEASLALTKKFEPNITAERERHWIRAYDAGLHAITQRRYREAETALKNAILIDPGKHDAHQRLAQCYVNTGRPNEALFIYNQLLQTSPEDLTLLLAVSNLFYAQNRFRETIAVLKNVLALEPQHRDALANLALSYEALGMVEEAEAAFEKAVQANPDDIDLIFLYGVHHYKRTNYTRAIQLFQQVLERKPDEFEAISNIGNAYLSMAEALRRELKTRPPGSLTPEALYQTKNQILLYYRRAIPYLERALELQPNNPNLWRNLGIAYLNTDEPKKGEEAFQKSESLKTNSLR